MNDDWLDMLAALLDAEVRFMVDLLTSLTGLPVFEGAGARRSVHPVRRLAVPFLGREDLLANTQATGQLKGSR